jgi:hypothetical protein
MFENGHTSVTDAELSGHTATATTMRNEERTLELICENRRITMEIMSKLMSLFILF